MKSVLILFITIVAQLNVWLGFSSIGFAAAHASEPSLNNSVACTYENQPPIMPIMNQNNAYDVGIGILPLRIYSFEPEQSSAEIDFYFTIEYLVDKQLDDTKCLGFAANDVWKIFYNPDIEFMSISNPQENQGASWLIEDGRFAYLTRISGTISIESDLRRFPFDETLIRVTVASEDNIETTRLSPSIWYHENFSELKEYFDRIKVPGWKPRTSKFSVEKYQFLLVSENFLYI